MTEVERKIEMLADILNEGCNLAFEQLAEIGFMSTDLLEYVINEDIVLSSVSSRHLEIWLERVRDAVRQAA